jgi:hypothetical protein
VVILQGTGRAQAVARAARRGWSNTRIKSPLRKGDGYGNFIRKPFVPGFSGGGRFCGLSPPNRVALLVATRLMLA